MSGHVEGVAPGAHDADQVTGSGSKERKQPGGSSSEASTSPWASKGKNSPLSPRQLPELGQSSQSPSGSTQAEAGAPVHYCADIWCPPPTE